MGASAESLRDKVAVKREQIRRRAKGGSFLDFIYYVNPRYHAAWHHRLVICEIESFLADPDRKKLMLFMPPQHGKSEIVSRMLPAFALGMNPDLKIAACSYSADLASSFNRDVQRVMDQTPYYADVFDDARLSGKRTVSDSRNSYLRNTKEFEIVNRRGSYKSVGVGGGLSGRTVDLAIIDDPVKDFKEAISDTVRESVWQWYLNVLEARLHNQSKVILVMTRWHEDDLAGRLLERQPGDWEVITLPAIYEKGGHPEDPRSVGDALWPEKHSREKILKLRALSERTYISLYQQRPSPPEGGLLKRSYWKYYNPAKVDWSKHVIHFFIDTAYTEEDENDPTAIMACTRIGRYLYVLDVTVVRMEFPDLIKFIPEYVYLRGGTENSAIVIEPKASGKSVYQMLRKNSQLSVIEDVAPTDSKLVRVTAIQPIPEAGRVLLPVNGKWVQAFITEAAAFPNGKFDDRVDVLEMACRKLIVNRPGGDGYRTASA